MRRIFVVTVLATCLASCSDGPRMWRESEIESIAEDFAYAAASDGANTVESDLTTRIDELERRIDVLERENQSQKAMIEELYSNQQDLADWVNRAHGYR